MGTSRDFVPAFNCTIDVEANGKQLGHVLIPYSRNDAGWAQLVLPIASIRRGDGPTALLIAGTHGDEYEGQIALRHLIHKLDTSDITGRVIIVPSLNLPAVKSSQRISPVDGLDLNRSYPGNIHGSLTQRIAAYVADDLVPRADLVLDLHSGGRSTMLEPCLIVHSVEQLGSQSAFQTTLDASCAFAPAIVLVLTEPDNHGLLDTLVEEVGKPFLCAELGGGASVSPKSIKTSYEGVLRVLEHLSITDGLASPSEIQCSVLTVPDGGMVLAADDGLNETLVELGDSVAVGDTIALLHSISHLERAPIRHSAKATGRIVARRWDVNTSHGDLLALVASPFDYANR